MFEIINYHSRTGSHSNIGNVSSLIKTTDSTIIQFITKKLDDLQNKEAFVFNTRTFKELAEELELLGFNITYKETKWCD